MRGPLERFIEHISVAVWIKMGPLMSPGSFISHFPLKLHLWPEIIQQFSSPSLCNGTCIQTWFSLSPHPPFVTALVTRHDSVLHFPPFFWNFMHAVLNSLLIYKESYISQPVILWGKLTQPTCLYVRTSVQFNCVYFWLINKDIPTHILIYFKL